MRENERVEPVYPKANLLNRFIAKVIDFLIALALSQLLPPVGLYAGITYLFIADGYAKGQSVGKYLLGLYVLSLHPPGINPFRLSILRNLPLTLAYVLFLIPYVGWVFFCLIVGLEGLLVFGNVRGLRLGDELARTQVIDQVALDTVL